MPRSESRPPRAGHSPAPTSGRGTALRAAPHKVRIIGGQWKRTPLPVVDGPGVRPTPDRVRETLFNWIGHLALTGLQGSTVLDLFAGTGALGFEAASRGAGKVVLVERNPAAIAQLRAMQARLNATMLEIRQGDAQAVLQILARDGLKFDLVFLDPPYEMGWLQRCLPQVGAVMAPGGLAYVEAESPLLELFVDVPELLDRFEILKADKAGQVFYHLLRCKIPPQNPITRPEKFR